MKTICLPLFLGLSVLVFAQAPQGVRGKIQSINKDDLVINDGMTNEQVHLAKGFTVYTRVPSSLAHVKSDSFVGITTVNTNGVERASEIHIFPAALRGLGEGSRMMGTKNPEGKPNRMTNGAVKKIGFTKPSRMTNGKIVKETGAGVEVAYKGGSIKIAVPPNVTVTEIVKSSASKLKPGMNVFALGTQMKDKSWTCKTVMITSPAKP